MVKILIIHLTQFCSEAVSDRRVILGNRRVRDPAGASKNQLKKGKVLRLYRSRREKYRNMTHPEIKDWSCSLREANCCMLKVDKPKQNRRPPYE
jgi:hypothetical protein